MYVWRSAGLRERSELGVDGGEVWRASAWNGGHVMVVHSILVLSYFDVKGRSRGEGLTWHLTRIGRLHACSGDLHLHEALEQCSGVFMDYPCYIAFSMLACVMVNPLSIPVFALQTCTQEGDREECCQKSGMHFSMARVMETFLVPFCFPGYFNVVMQEACMYVTFGVIFLSCSA